MDQQRTREISTRMFERFKKRELLEAFEPKSRQHSATSVSHIARAFYHRVAPFVINGQDRIIFSFYRTVLWV